MKTPPLHKADVTKFSGYNETTGLPEYEVLFEKGTLDRGNSGTMTAFQLLRKIAIIKQKMAANRLDPEHVLDVAHGAALTLNETYVPEVPMSAAA